MTEVIHGAEALRARCDTERSRGRRIGLVPTMGALHEGHLSLIAAVRAAGAQHVVVSVFVNPLQFGEGEDFERYPRTLEQDVARCRQSQVDLVYAPEADGMYPEGFQTHVDVDHVTQGLEGAHRPTHFRGVTTVVAKLFNATGPCIAAFGRKDYQQWRTIERMARDLDMPVEVLGCPILRERDGLAMSSRNRYLTDSQRERATAIHRGLQAASRAFAGGERSVHNLEALTRASVAGAFDRIDYVALADPETVEPLVDQAPDSAVMLVAAHLGQTRLIDNATLGRECLEAP